MKYEKGSFATIPNIQNLKGENPITQVVYMWICFHSNQEGICYPSQKTLADECGISLRSLNTYLKRLEDIGIIKRLQRKIEGKKENDTTIYEVLCTAPRALPTAPDARQVLHHVQRELNTIKLNNISFDLFWKKYAYSKGKAMAEKSWNKLKDSERELAMNAVSLYVASTPDKKFRKHAATWLNQKCWLDEVEIDYVAETKKMNMATFAARYGDDKLKEYANHYFNF